MDKARHEKVLTDPYGWISVKDRMPETNISVIVFIPEEDHHITTGMWDVSRKWVLLDEYRIPQSEVTYWMPMLRKPLDTSYTPCNYVEHTTDEIIRTLQMENYQLKSVLREMYLHEYGGNSRTFEESVSRSDKNDVNEQKIISLLLK